MLKKKQTIQAMPEISTEPISNKSPEVYGRLKKKALSKYDRPASAVKKKKRAILKDRPGWIPPEIKHNWDTCPYAYQTEEELMPAGGLHGERLLHIAEILRDFLNMKGLRFLADTFILYRDAKGIKQRISPDLLIMPFRSEPPSAYDLDIEQPPLAVVEITSPKSRIKDINKKVTFYSGLGITTYLVIDQITNQGKPRDPIELHLWRKTNIQMCKISPDSDGWLFVPEMKMKIKSDGRKLILADIETGEILKDKTQERLRAEQQIQIAEKERLRAEQQIQIAEKERSRAEREKQKAEKERLRAEQQIQIAEKERSRAEQEKQKAEKGT